jgi:hypothetical protein
MAFRGVRLGPYFQLDTLTSSLRRCPVAGCATILVRRLSHSQSVKLLSLSKMAFNWSGSQVAADLHDGMFQ